MEDSKKMTKTEFLAYLFFSIITFCKAIGLEGSNKIYIAAYAFGTFIIIIKIFSEPIRKNELISLIIILLIGLVDFFIGDITTVLFTAIAFFCLKKVNIKKVIKIMFFIRLIAFVGMIFLSTTGIIENRYLVFFRSGEGFLKRYCLGFSHPNFAHSSFAIIILLWGYLYNKKINAIRILVVEICNYVLYMFTLSRTGFLIITLYLIYCLVDKKISYVYIISSKFIKYSMWFFIVFSIFIAIGYGKISFIDKLNVLLTGRISYMNTLISNHTIPIIGSNFYNSVVLFDNGYFSLLYEGGILATIWYVYMANKTNEILFKKNMRNEIILTLFFMIYCLFESYYMNILMNPILLFFAYYIFKADYFQSEKN